MNESQKGLILVIYLIIKKRRAICKIILKKIKIKENLSGFNTKSLEFLKLNNHF